MSEAKRPEDVVWTYTVVKYCHGEVASGCDWYVEHTPDGLVGKGDWICDCVTEEDATKIAAAMNAYPDTVTLLDESTELLAEAMDDFLQPESFTDHADITKRIRKQLKKNEQVLAIHQAQGGDDE